MKKITTLFALLISAMCVATEAYELRVLTFEDDEVKNGFEFLVKDASKWSDIIDPQQQYGEMLYGVGNAGGSEQIYSWYDGDNTFLFSELLNAYGTVRLLLRRRSD